MPDSPVIIYIFVMPESNLQIERPDAETLRVVLAGRWTYGKPAPFPSEINAELQSAGLRRVQFDCRGLAEWDSILAVFLSRLISDCDSKAIDVDSEGLPNGIRRLLALSKAIPGKEAAAAPPGRPSVLIRIGEAGIRGAAALKNTLDFIGDLVLSFMRLAMGRARFRPQDLWEQLQECGWNALPIVSLISILVGLILAFMGAVQLQMFGAQIYVADLVGIGMTREMGAIMTGVIMAGRTGAAFAANIGTMQVNEEIDALRTLGVSPMDILVLPRTAALVLMMPLLCIYADFMGLLGGMAASVGAFDISATQYLHQTLEALTVTHFSVGVVKSVFFGLIVAVCGCMQGMNCGRSASGVGRATTSAVVIAIVAITVADGLFAVLTNKLGI